MQVVWARQGGFPWLALACAWEESLTAGVHIPEGGDVVCESAEVRLGMLLLQASWARCWAQPSWRMPLPKPGSSATSSASLP